MLKEQSKATFVALQNHINFEWYHTESVKFQIKRWQFLYSTFQFRLHEQNSILLTFFQKFLYSF